MPTATSSERKRGKSPNTPEAKSTTPKQQPRISQSMSPLFSLEEALKIPKAIKGELASQPNVPILVAKACKMSPTSSQWRLLSSASVAYGLTTGAYNAKEIGLTPLGSRIVSPLKERDDILAIREAAFTPTLFHELFKKYNNAKLPREDIAINVIESLGVPADRQKKAWDIFRANATFAGALQIISGSEYLIHSSTDNGTVATNTPPVPDPDLQDNSAIELPPDVMERMQVSPEPQTAPAKVSPPATPKIFISHGKNSSTIVGQLKELISYGQMKAVVSVEHETTAIPVPTKVFDDMRTCDAGIIHVNLEEHHLVDGTIYTQINENVLIEIGAAMALYSDRVILLCEEGTALPSNLQGLYRCEYSGNQLDYNSTIKLLKAMQEIRQKITNP